jgi:hypothetical protein
MHVDFPLFQRLAMPIPSGRTKIPGIKIHETRMVRLMEVLLHGGSQTGGWRTAQIHDAIKSHARNSRNSRNCIGYDARRKRGTVKMPFESPARAWPNQICLV